MPRVLFLLAVAPLGLFAIVFERSAQDSRPTPESRPAESRPASRVDDPFSFEGQKALEALLAARTTVIQSEISANLDHSWAGLYSTHMLGGGSSLWIAPKAGFVYRGTGCLGLYEWAIGVVEVDGDGELVLRYERGEIEGSSRLVSTSVGRDRFLVPDKQMLSFCNAAQSAKPNWTGFLGFYQPPPAEYFRTGKMPADPSPLVSVPPRWHRYLVGPAIEPTVLEVSEVSRSTEQRLKEFGMPPFVQATLRLDLGTKDGVFIGMRLNIPDGVVICEITDASEHSSRASYFSMEQERAPYKPFVGQRLSTREQDDLAERKAASAPASKPAK